MGAIASTLVSLPFTQLRRNRYFYLWYDLFYLVFCVGAIAAMRFTGWTGFQWRPWMWLLLPLIAYAQILCSVFIHNCTHNNFPRRINRLVGELCGAVVLTRFASWEIIHQRHHRYSDDLELDPHPVERSYWRFLVHTLANVEIQLQRIYFELYGDTPANRIYEKRRAYLSYLTNIVLIVAWFHLFGPVAFFALFVPASIVGFLHLVHFNWSTHNGMDGRDGFHPVNIDSGLFWIGNRLFFGIYWHANHHKKTNLFNPGRLEQVQRKKQESARSSHISAAA